MKPTITIPDECFDIDFQDYQLQSRVLLSGIGADEMCGGYMRYSTAYSHGGYEESWKEMIMDWNRLWVRNLVRYLCDNMIS